MKKHVQISKLDHLRYDFRVGLSKEPSQATGALRAILKGVKEGAAEELKKLPGGSIALGVVESLLELSDDESGQQTEVMVAEVNGNPRVAELAANLLMLVNAVISGRTSSPSRTVLLKNILPLSNWPRRPAARKRIC